MDDDAATAAIKTCMCARKHFSKIIYIATFATLIKINTYIIYFIYVFLIFYFRSWIKLPYRHIIEITLALLPSKLRALAAARNKLCFARPLKNSWSSIERCWPNALFYCARPRAAPCLHTYCLLFQLFAFASIRESITFAQVVKQITAGRDC